MKYEGERVTHKSFGDGTVVSLKNAKLTVAFDTGKTIDFSCPSCFNQFLALTDPELQAAALNEAAAYLRQKEDDERKKEEERKLEAATLRLSTDTPKTRSISSDTPVKRFDNVQDFVEYFDKALQNETNYVRENGGKRLRLTNGKYITRTHSTYIYSFEADSECYYPDDTSIQIFIKGKEISGIIVTCDDFNVTISSPLYMGVELSAIEISADTWQLLVKLIEKTKKLSDNPSKIVKTLICDGYSNIYSGDIITGQDHAVKMATFQPITFIWGPPGTGKTETLAKIAKRCLMNNYRVLMLSYSNVSVDGAALRTAQLCSDSKPGEILRYGYGRDKELSGEKCLDSYEYTIRKNRILYQRYKSLQKNLAEVSKDSVEYVNTKAKLKELHENIKAAEKAAVSTAKFVATTVTKAVIDLTVFGGNYDVVIFDEASMAYIPQIVYAASLAKKHFVCMGDFSQLPPIVQNSNTSALNCDIFAYCGISDAVNSGKSHKWLCMLDTQYRMHKNISDFAGASMYASKLHTAPEIIRERESMAAFFPFPGNSITTVDLSQTASYCTKTTDNSRINLLSAFISFGTALCAAKKQEVGIITPYAAQTRLYRAMARDAAAQCPDLFPVVCATVHQFQGSQKDVIIFDAVDCYIQPYPGVLLNSQQNNSANRLFNVAMTRARGKFINVANVDYLLQHLSSEILLKKFFRYCKSLNLIVKGNEFKSKIDINNSFFALYDYNDNFDKYFLDLRRASHSIIVDIPEEMENNRKFISAFSHLLGEAKMRNVKVSVRSKVCEKLPKEIKPYAHRYDFIYNPITIIDKKTVWYGLPYSSNDFCLKNGTTIDTEYKPIIRIQGEKTATALYNFLDI